MNAITKISLVVFLFVSFYSFSQNTGNCLLVDLPFNGNAQDQTIYQNHGKVHGAVLTEDRFGVPSSAYYFDGVDDWIELDTSGLRNNVYSFSLWAKTWTLPSQNGYIALSIGQTGGDQQIIYGYYPRFNQYGWGCSSYSQGFPADTNYGSLGDTTKWHHIVTVRDNNEIVMYLDGKHFGTMPVGNRTADYGSLAVASIGSRWGGYQFLHGKIDDVKIYNCKLSAGDVQNLYGNPTRSYVNFTHQNTFSLFPIPISETLNIRITSEELPVSGFIQNLSGQQVHHFNFTGINTSLDLSFLESGFYLLSVFYKNGSTISRKILVNK